MHHISRFTGGSTLLLGALLAGCESTSTTATPVASVVVSPSTNGLVVGETVQLQAALRDQAGNLLSGRSVAWSSNAPAVATVDASGLVLGTGPGSAVVTATAEGVSGSAQIAVQGRSLIELSRTAVTFEALRGEADPPVEVVGITNAGEAPLIDLSTSVTYLEGGATGWLASSLSSTRAPSSLRLEASVVGLTAGTYRARVDVASDVADNSPQAVQVLFTVVEPPAEIELSTNEVALEAPETSITPVRSTVGVSNGGGGTLTGLEVSIEYPPGQPVGWLEAVLDADRAPTTLALAATAGALPPATYTATVSVTSADAANSPQTLAVTFVVVPRAAAARPSPVEERIPIDR